MKPETQPRLLSVAINCAALFVLSLQAAPLPSFQQVDEMLMHERFDELEKLTSELREEKLDFYAGYSNLSRAYGYLDGPGRKAEESVWKEYIIKLEKWAQAYPQSPTPLVALGNTYTSWAWKARGGGYADSVNRQAWKVFKDRLENARRYLNVADKLPTKDPEVYRALIVVAMGLNWPKAEMEAVFKKGVEIEPNYMQLYQAKAYYLLPRWHGEPGEWEAFAQEVADARGGEEGDILYMNIGRSEAWSEGAEFFRNTRISYARMKRGFESSLRRYPNYVWEMNSFCYFACIAADRPTARDLFAKIDGQWEKEVWERYDTFAQWQTWATQNGRAPAAAAPGRLTRPGITSEQVESALLIAGAIWLGIVVVVAAAVWSIVRTHQKSRQ